MTGKDVDVVIVVGGSGTGYVRGDQQGKDKKDVFILDLKDLENGLFVSDLYGHEASHVDDHRRGRDAGDELNADSPGNRLSEILGDKGKSSGFNIEKWLNNEENLKSLINGEELLGTEYEGYTVEGKGCVWVHAICVPNDEPIKLQNRFNDMKMEGYRNEVKKAADFIIEIMKDTNSGNGNNSGKSTTTNSGKNGNDSSNKVSEKTCDSTCFTENLNKNYYYNPLNAIMDEKNQEMSNYYNPSYYLTNLDYEKLFTDIVNDLSKRPTSELFDIVHTDAVNNNKIVPGFNTKQNLADLQEQGKSTELYNIYDSVRPGGLTVEEADRLSKRIGVAQKASIVRDELEAPLLITLFTQLGYEAYNKKYGLTDIGGGTQVVGKYAPEVVARDVTNSAASNNYSSPGLLPYTPSNSGLITYTPPYAGLLTYTSSNSGLLTYTQEVPRTNHVYVNDSTAGGTIINQVELNGWKPTVLPSNSGDPILMPDFPFYSTTTIGGKLVQLDNLHTVYPDDYSRKGLSGGHNEDNFNNYLIENDIRMRVLNLTEYSTTIGDVINIKYQIAQKDPRNMGVFLEPSQYNPNTSNPPTKTLYDPQVISNKQMIDWAMEASKNAIQLKPGSYKGTTKDGLEFIFYDQNNGTFRYYPQIPNGQGVK